MNDDLMKVYTGSSIEANYLVDLLKDNGIAAFSRDSLNESLIAGWVSGSQECSATIYVNRENVEKSKELIKTFLETR